MAIDEKIVALIKYKRIYISLLSSVVYWECYEEYALFNIE